MSGIPYQNVLPLEGGAICAGIAITLCTEAFYTFGFSVNIFNDQSRQKFVNLICLVGAVAGAVFYGSNQTKLDFMTTNVSVFILFLCGQYGLAILNHNTIIRACTLFPMFARANIEYVQKLCLVLYVLPWIALTPIYFAIGETYPKGVALTTSPWNTVTSKFLFMGLIVVTEVLATITDMLLLKQVQNLDSSNMTAARAQKTRDVNVSYAAIWVFMVIDIILKVLIANGYPVLFDGTTTIICIALRTRANLNYGLLLKEVLTVTSAGSMTHSKMQTPGK
ncbi:hypothetical protein EDD86DRAFT_218706 [Gorgonomyces haynaldii]|nr:hypothetical protein EDD86DRAFT_218706 [Gorgonomyces haynaldii]